MKIIGQSSGGSSAPFGSSSNQRAESNRSNGDRTEAAFSSCDSEVTVMSDSHKRKRSAEEEFGLPPKRRESIVDSHNHSIQDFFANRSNLNSSNRNENVKFSLPRTSSPKVSLKSTKNSSATLPNKSSKSDGEVEVVFTGSLPKKPMSAFGYFAIEIKKEIDSDDIATIGKIIAEKWKSLDPFKRRKYENMVNSNNSSNVPTAEVCDTVDNLRLKLLNPSKENTLDKQPKLHIVGKVRRPLNSTTSLNMTCGLSGFVALVTGPQSSLESISTPSQSDSIEDSREAASSSCLDSEVSRRLFSVNCSALQEVLLFNKLMKTLKVRL